MGIPRKFTLIVAAILLAMSALAQSVQAQEGGESNRPMTAEEMLRLRTQRVEEFLRRLDANGDGSLDADEMDGSQKLLLERMIGAKGEVKYPLDIKQVLDTHMKNYRAMVMPSDAGTGANAKPSPATPAAARPTGVHSAATAPPNTAPLNTRPQTSAAAASAPNLVSAHATKPTMASTRKGIRFLTPGERLPKGLPEWFKAKDRNGDGQIGMAEFAADWTPAAEAEFLRYDLNHDGFITPDECLKVEKDAKGGK